MLSAETPIERLWQEIDAMNAKIRRGMLPANLLGHTTALREIAVQMRIDEENRGRPPRGRPMLRVVQ